RVALRLATAAQLSPLENLYRQIAADNTQVPAIQEGKMFPKKHGNAVGLLSAGASSAPDVQGTFGRPAAHQFGKNLLPEGFERVQVSKERRFIVGQDLDHLLLQGAVRLRAHLGQKSRH